MITLANAIGVAMYVIGFCESFLDMLYEYSEFTGIGKYVITIFLSKDLSMNVLTFSSWSR